MKKFYIFILFFIICRTPSLAQLSATIQSFESRCAATGSVKIVASGGSGSYQYKVQGPLNTNFTDKDSITGLAPGVYTVIINDIITNATISQPNIAVAGSYADPRFGLDHMDVSCDNGSNGSISVSNVEFGRGPFTYSIVAPSPMGVGTSNSLGIFAGLKAGDYSIQMRDSCGGIQTRTVTINNYSWDINSYDFNKTSCDYGSGYIKVRDSKNNYTPSIPGFAYGLVTTPGDTIWNTSGSFSNAIITGLSSVDLLAKDMCGNIKKRTVTSSLTPSVDGNVNIFNVKCNSFSAAVTGAKNFFTAEYALYNENGDKISENLTGQFEDLSYGTYCIKVHDVCTDTIIERCFTQNAPVASLDNIVKITNKNCDTYTASITGQHNLTNPRYCLFDSETGTELDCNDSGIFTNLSTGKEYCIKTKDNCIDTTITRCFFINKPIPQIPPVITPSYINCRNFGLHITGDSLTNPTFCLFDTDHNPVQPCNQTGIFDSIPLGNYYVTIHDECRDTTIKRDIHADKPTINNDIQVNISGRNCETFTATASSSNMVDKEFCIYRSSDSSLIDCNNNGVFKNLPYGNYYITGRSQCPDTLMFRSFTIQRDVPYVNTSPKITNKKCTTFDAEITNQQNLINPAFCLIDTTSKAELGCNSTGKFTSIPYGSYVVRVTTECHDTLKVYFSQKPDSVVLSASAVRSCNYGYTKFNVSVIGVLPVNIKIYTPGIQLIKDNNFSSSSFSIDDLPALPAGDKYTVVATDPCGNTDTIRLAPVVGYLEHTPSVTNKCPGSVWPNGSGNINTTVSTNLPGIKVRIIKKNSSNVSINPDYSSGSNYRFNDLGPATYVISYTANDNCNKTLYDTVTIATYKFPNLNRSSAYQCDTSGFSIGATVTGGVGPFTYEIIGSSPGIPSLVTVPQTDPVFSINNGTVYSLVRLRATDACGNASLADASILPLADNGIRTSMNCLQNPTTLSVDTIYNATYTWSKKTNMESTDSTLISDGIQYYISDLMPEDTGIYICHINVHNGCVKRTYYFHLDGSCGKVLPLSIENFKGKLINGTVALNWEIHNANTMEAIIIERQTAGGFVEIGRVKPSSAAGETAYSFTDEQPSSANLYRIRIIQKNNASFFSNVISVQKLLLKKINIYPNPVNDVINIEFSSAARTKYKIALVNMLNQSVKEIIFSTEAVNKIQMKRTKDMAAGIYILHFINLETNESFSQKIILGPR